MIFGSHGFFRTTTIRAMVHYHQISRPSRLISLHRVFQHASSIPALSTITSKVAKTGLYQRHVNGLLLIHFFLRIFTRGLRPYTEFGESLLDDPGDYWRVRRMNSQGIPIPEHHHYNCQFELRHSLSTYIQNSFRRTYEYEDNNRARALRSERNLYNVHQQHLFYLSDSLNCRNVPFHHPRVVNCRFWYLTSNSYTMDILTHLPWRIPTPRPQIICIRRLR